IRLPGFHHADEVTLCLENGEERTFRGDGSYAHEFDTVADEIRAGRTESAYVRPADTIAVMRLLDDCRKQLGLVYPFER
ncbi:MAG: gfo/Idh/MocA family oxidoreductase, partial [Clostridia bacterium]|nr:gfo/Idh/MocA family oxidoreductase [Clostridia bacterium]